jgi:hypothetical protein
MGMKMKRIEDHFKLPRRTRNKFFGLWYVLPELSFEEFMEDDYVDLILKYHPIQGRIREKIIPWFQRVFNFYDYYKTIKRWIKPCHPRWRKVLPRHRYSDVDHLIEESVFALVLDFWYEEARPEVTFVDWSVEETGHAEFYEWLQKAVQKIEEEFPRRDKELHETPIDKVQLFLDKERELNKDKDNLLKEIIDRKGYMWT